MNDSDPRLPLEPQVMFDRSRQSAFDLLKTVISLATGSLAAYFVALTRSGELHLTSVQQGAASRAMVCMVAAIAIGLLAWGSDAVFYNAWAHSLQKEPKPGRWWQRRNLAGRLRITLLWLLAALFLGGVWYAGKYVWLRVSAA
jgi:hypothetical protein